jgi:hypothetical protein
MYEFINPAGRARAAIMCVWIWLAADFFYAVTALVTIAALGGLGDVRPAPETADTMAVISGGALMLGYIVTVVVVARWILRVNANAHAISDAMTVTPGWNVGWFFIPIANLWKPFEGLRQTWQASANPADPGSVSVPDIMRWWWGFWLATNILGNISFRISLNANTPEPIITGAWIDVISFVLDIGLTWTFAAVIRDLTALQDRGERYAETFA